MKIIKAGTTELTEGEAQKIYEDKMYLCNNSGVYQPFYSVAQRQFYFRKVIDHKGYTQRGRFFIQTAEQINHVLGCQLLNNI